MIIKEPFPQIYYSTGNLPDGQATDAQIQRATELGADVCIGEWPELSTVYPCVIVITATNRTAIQDDQGQATVEQIQLASQTAQ